MTTNEEQPFFTSRRESKRYIAESLQLQDAMILGIVPPETGLGRHFSNTLPEAMSFLWLDMSKRPALRDLARVHATEGEGESIFKWVYIDEHKQNCYFVLNVNMQKPVRETFRIAIRMQEWAALVEVISTTGTMSIFAGPPVAWRQLIKTMDAPALIHLIHEQSRGDVTFTFSQETISELRQHYEAWVERFAKEEEGASTKKAHEPVAVIESLISWNIKSGRCQQCHQEAPYLSELELYFPLDLYQLMRSGQGEEAKYTVISGVTNLALEQVRDQFTVSEKKLVCDTCLKSVFSVFTKKNVYETTKSTIEQEGSGRKRAWSAIFYCLFLRGDTHHDMIHKSISTHITMSDLGARPSLHDLVTMGNDAARKQYPSPS